jgi:hypothetical protein
MSAIENYDQTRQNVEAIVRASKLRDRLQDVLIERNDDPDQPFLRVFLRMRDVDRLATADLVALQIEIEDRLAEIGQSDTSIRFAKAA